MLIRYGRKLLALLLAMSLLLLGTATTAFGEEASQPAVEQTETAEPTKAPTPAPTATPTVKPTPTVEPTATPTIEPTATPSPEPTEEEAAKPTATPVEETPETEEASPAPSPTVEPTGEPVETEHTPTQAEPAVTPVPAEEPEEAVFAEGMVWLGKGTVLYADAKCTEVFATVTEKGAVYAVVGESAIAAKLTLDGKT